MARIVAREGLVPLLRDLATDARVHYKKLWRHTKCFIAGTVSAAAGDIIDRVAGAQIVLAFGDFKFDRLEGDGTADTVVVAADGFVDARIDVELTQTKNIGEIRLEPSGPRPHSLGTTGTPTRSPK